MGTGNNQPKDLPSFEITLDGNALKSTFHVHSITVTKEINRIASARIVLADGDYATGKFEVSDQPDFIPGVKIEIKAGYHSKNKTIFRGVIVNQSIRSKHSGLPLLVVDCKDEAYQMTLSLKSDFFYKVKDSDLIKNIAQKYGLKMSVEDTKTEHKEMVQFQSTDWEFCVNRAERNGKYVVTEDGQLTVVSPDLSASPILKLQFGSNILELETEIESRQQFATVKTEAWDTSRLELQSYSGQKPSFKEQGNLSTTSLSGLAKGNDYQLAHSGRISAAELQALSDARLYKAYLSKIQGRVKCQGTSEVLPGKTIAFEKMSKRFDGVAFVSGIRHTVNEKDWETDIQFGWSGDWTGEPTKISTINGFVPDIGGLHVGIVTQLEGDPDSEERILVKIPAINPKKDGIWARIACLDAGNNRGTVFRPEIGDEVVIGFFANDPRYPVILGMLNSSKNPAPIQAKDKNDQKGFVSRDGLKLLFDDKDKILTLESPNGNTLTISDKDGGISFKDENQNSITMDKDGITLKSGKDLKLKSTGKLELEGGDISIKAEKALECSGGTGAEFTSDASAVIKGSLVEIN